MGIFADEYANVEHQVQKKKSDAAALRTSMITAFNKIMHQDLDFLAIHGMKIEGKGSSTVLRVSSSEFVEVSIDVDTDEFVLRDGSGKEVARDKTAEGAVRSAATQSYSIVARAEAKGL